MPARGRFRKGATAIFPKTLAAGRQWPRISPSPFPSYQGQTQNRPRSGGVASVASPAALLVLWQD